MTFRREHDDGRRAPMRNLAQFCEDVQSADVRHHDVEEYQIDWIFGVKSFESATAVLHQLDAVGTRFELELDNPPDIGLVVDDQDISRVYHCRHHSQLVR